MKTWLIVLLIFVAIVILFPLLMILLTPWMDRKGSTPEERSLSFPGDDLVKEPKRISNRAITIHASPAEVFSWIVQTGADKSGMYSYTWLENLVGCTMAKVEVIRPEWQQLKEGDLMKMCDSETAPPPYIVAKVLQNDTVVYGHREDSGEWVDLWIFRLIPQSDGSTRLIARTRTMMVGGFWEVIRPISFLMEQKMLHTIKKLSEMEK